jgi:aryl-alcohol dehydrogenase-like predicted oxidoreductase
MESSLIPGRATPEGTAAYAAEHPGHFRQLGGLHLSTVGHGSYIGKSDAASRAAYQEAIFTCLQGGINVLDTASNYRDQASERDVGAALARFIEAGGSRDQVLVTSKAGFLHGDCDSPLRGPEWFQTEYGRIVGGEDVIGSHCMTPAYIDHELQRSRANLGLETIDVYFVHNPESQVDVVGEDAFYARIRTAFELLERRADDGQIKIYGVATWDGLRRPPGNGHISLLRLVHEAGQAAMALGKKASEHRFRAIELPVNLAMTEALTAATQPWKFGMRQALECAAEVGMLTLGSASLLQARIGDIPDIWQQALGADGLEAMLQFARDAPGLTTALVGMGKAEHAHEILAWSAKPPAKVVKTMLGSGWGHD